MANKFRSLKGDQQIKKVPVDSATVIEIGDLVYLDTDDAKPAGDLAYGASLAATQESFHDIFLGVALDQSRSGDTEEIRVATPGGQAVFEYDCASATFEIGDLVGMDDNAGGTALLDQQVIAVASENLAIGRVSRREPSAVTKVQITIHSTVMQGGPQAAA